MSAATAQKHDKEQSLYQFHIIDPGGTGHCYVDAHGLNDARQVVVDWADATDADPYCWLTQAWLWDNGEWKPLSFADPDCPDTSPYLTSLNNRGLSFGVNWSPGCNYQVAAAIDVSAGTWFKLPDVPDFPWNQGFSMNNSGHAVGVAYTDLGLAKHWIWNGSQYADPQLPPHADVSPGWAGPLFINSAGQIAGQYIDTKTGVSGGKVTSRPCPMCPLKTRFGPRSLA